MKSNAMILVFGLLLTCIECSSFISSSSGDEISFVSYLMGYPHCQQQSKGLVISNASISIVTDSPCHYDMVGSAKEDNDVLGLLLPTGRPACEWETITKVAKAHNYVAVVLLSTIWTEKTIGGSTKISWHNCEAAVPFFTSSVIKSNLTGHTHDLERVSLWRDDNPYDSAAKIVPFAIAMVATFVLALLKGYIALRLANVQRKNLDQVPSVLVILAELIQSFIPLILLGDQFTFLGLIRADVYIILLNASALFSNLSTAFVAYAFLCALESVGILSPTKSRRIIFISTIVLLVSMQAWSTLSLAGYISNVGLNSAVINSTVCMICNIVASALFIRYKTKIKAQFAGQQHKSKGDHVGKMSATLRMSVVWIIISNLFFIFVGVAGVLKDFEGVQWTGGFTGIANIFLGMTQLLSLGSVEEAGFGRLQSVLVNAIQKATTVRLEPHRKSTEVKKPSESSRHN